jgi:hydrogenase nickel incorporation protein HypA/HybF
MHELSIARALVEMASQYAARAGAARVLRLNCRIGVMRQIEDDLMQGAFEAARVGTSCETAELCIEKSPLRARCRACTREFIVREWNWSCTTCGADGELLDGGDELELLSIEAGG